MLFTGQADVKPSFNKEAGYNQWPKFPCLIFLLYYHSSTFLNILAVPNNVVFCAAHKSILISILSTYFSKFFETLPRGPKTTGITSNLLRFQSLWISFEILVLFNLLLFLVYCSLVPRYYDIYNYCCLFHFIENNIWFPFHNDTVTLFIHVP